MTKRQEQILEIVRREGPITGERIAERLHLTRATLRPDLTVLTMAGFLDARPRVGYFYVGKPMGEVIADQLRKMKVKDYKSVPVVVSEGTSVYDAIVTMFLEDVGTLFVVRDQAVLAGVVSRKDLLKVAIGAQDVREVPVGLAMTRMPNIIVVTPEENVYEAARKLIDYQIDALPVVRVMDAHSKQLEVVGRFTKTTIARIFVELGSGRDI
ncbi:MAG: helix-turn-helix transcriptional regulator [Kyrpidia tusciae]|nr:helix-turn-helix transcriptional regulator [Kyrpidia tusciae]MBE3551672.1 helix-turn-helix transcriptional regulator [Kyrpidia tusciae]